jgi:hypothetical protein
MLGIATPRTCGYLNGNNFPEEEGRYVRNLITAHLTRLRDFREDGGRKQTLSSRYTGCSAILEQCNTLTIPIVR